MGFEQELALHLRARSPLVVVATPEEERALAAVKAVCAAQSYECLTWDSADGFVTVAGTLSLKAGDPKTALEQIDKAEVQEADRVLGAELTYAGQGLRRGIPDYDQGANRNAADDVLARWLWVHSSGSRLVFSRDYREGGRPTLVWSFDSFMGALYHLLQEDLTAGQLIRRCADPKCRVFFRPDRDGKYHDLKCRTRVRLAAARARKKAEAAASQDGPGDERPPGHEQEEER